MKLDKLPQAKSLTRLALLAALTGCAGQQPQAQEAADCDPSDINNVEVISADENKQVFRVCDYIYTSEKNCEETAD